MWHTRQETISRVAQQHSKTAKLKLLKIQLNFRKQVMNQKSYHDKGLFLFSKNRQQHSVDNLIENLCKLLSDEEAVHKEANSERESFVGRRLSTGGEMNTELSSGT